MLFESPLESIRFEVKAGKLDVKDAHSLKEDLEQAKSEGYEFLSCRVPSNNLHLIQDLEVQGFFTADVLLYYKKKVNSEIRPEETLRSCLDTQNHKDAVVNVATAAFHNYPSHYFMDRRLPQEKVAQIYPDWAARCCQDPGAADEILGYFVGESLAGFVALKTVQNHVDIRLAAVHPEYQGRGILKHLLQGAEGWAANQNKAEVFYSTQLDNIPPQKVLVRQGWEPSHSFHTLHFWF